MDSSVAARSAMEGSETDMESSFYDDEEESTIESNFESEYDVIDDDV